MSKSVQIKILIFFIAAVFVITPLAVILPQVTALTENAYEKEKGKITETSPDEDGKDDSAADSVDTFDMFGEVAVSNDDVAVTTLATEPSTKLYQSAVKKNHVTPTQPGVKEEIATTSPQEATLPYEKVGKNMDVRGRKLKTLPAPSDASKNSQLSKGYLIAIKNPDPNYAYNGKTVKMTEKDLDIAGRLIMGEAGTMGFYGCCLVAQAIRDTYYYGHFDSVNAVRKGYGYDGSIKHKPNAAAQKAVKYILQEGHSAIQHRILYFYNPRLCSSSFHENHNYLLTYKDVRFFDK
ncbi:MAG: hypothetical protein J1F17_01025 [Oscillospiraceae bacterium]|nr:hypothetical protein [Oscillospiraceae bacterium]